MRLLKDGELLSKFSFAPLDESQQFKQFNRFGEKLNGLTAASFKPDEQIVETSQEGGKHLPL